MWPLLVVEVDPIVDDALSSKAIGDVLKINCFIFEGPPQPFDKDIVQVAPTSIHTDAHARIG